MEKEYSEFKPVKLRLKIDLVSYPARAEGLGKYDVRSPDIENGDSVYDVSLHSVLQGRLWEGVMVIDLLRHRRSMFASDEIE